MPAPLFVFGRFIGEASLLRLFACADEDDRAQPRSRQLLSDPIDHLVPLTEIVLPKQAHGTVTSKIHAHQTGAGSD
jgi:hypothetical protein